LKSSISKLHQKYMRLVTEIFKYDCTCENEDAPELAEEDKCEICKLKNMIKGWEK